VLTRQIAMRRWRCCNVPAIRPKFWAWRKLTVDSHQPGAITRVLGRLSVLNQTVI
jgi:hypothetical protein